MEATPFSVEDHIIIISWRHHHHVYLIDKTQVLSRDQRDTVLPVTETTLPDQGVKARTTSNQRQPSLMILYLDYEPYTISTSNSANLRASNTWW